MKKQMILLALMLLPMVAGAYNAQMGGIYCDFDKTNKTATVTYYSSGNNYQDNKNAYSGNVIIPPTVNYNGVTYDVTSIGQNAFRSCSGLTSITLPNSIKYILLNAFCDCTNLTAITIPNSVTYIGGGAFRNCGLKSVMIPSSVTGIEGSSFSGCNALSSIKVKTGNAVYDSRDNCNAIIHTPTNSLISGCKNTIIPNSVTSIENLAFFECSSLVSITIPNSVTWIGIEAFSSCSGLTSVKIPNSVTWIGEMAFDHCTGLTSVTIGSGVINIGTSAFSFCEKLTEFYCLAKDVPKERTADGLMWEGQLFYNSLIEYATLYVPSASIDAYKTRESWKSFRNIVGLTDEEIQEIMDSSEPSGTPKCATPTIIANGNRLLYECETPGAEFTTNVSTSEELPGEEVVIENKDRIYTLTVYATAPGYARSKPATMKMILKATDVNGDGSVDVADIATIIDKMAGK